MDERVTFDIDSFIFLKASMRVVRDSNESLATANILVLVCLLEKYEERMRRIGNANLPLTHRSKSATREDVAIVALPRLAI